MTPPQLNKKIFLWVSKTGGGEKSKDLDEKGSPAHVTVVIYENCVGFFDVVCDVIAHVEPFHEHPTERPTHFVL